MRMPVADAGGGGAESGWVYPAHGWVCAECGFDYDACAPAATPETLRGFGRRYRVPLVRGLPGEAPPRYEFAQPICPPGFQAQLPPMRTPIAGFFMADTAYYYPEDRSISESLRIGQELALHAGAAGE